MLPTKPLQLNNITLSFAAKIILSKVFLKLEAGEIIGLVGANGAGKTTLLRICAGILKPDEGEVLLFDKNIGRYSRKEIAANIAYLPQTLDADVEFTVEEFLRFSRYARRKSLFKLNSEDYAAISKAVEITEIASFVERRMNALSGGEKQRVFIAGAIAQQAQILLLDEPTTFLDPHYWKELADIIRKLKNAGLSLIIATHSINFALNVCDGIIALKDGKVAFSGSVQNFVRVEVLSEIYENAQFKIIEEQAADENGKRFFVVPKI